MKHKFIVFLYCIISIATFVETRQAIAQDIPNISKDIRQVVKERLEGLEVQKVINGKIYTSKPKFEDICRLTDTVEYRIFKEYGAIFVADNSVKLPHKCIFSSENEVEFYQNIVKPITQNVNGISIELQPPAMQSLLKAIREAAQKKLRISPRGGSLAAGRSFQDTVNLWNSRFHPGLNYWVGKRKINNQEADIARSASVRDQIETVFKWEDKGIFFSKDLMKSILYSVAAPGASQHNFLLALDVEQYSNKNVRDILAANGWFQTVYSDFPHFTYLGLTREELPNKGLKLKKIGEHEFWIPNIIETSNFGVKK